MGGEKEVRALRARLRAAAERSLGADVSSVVLGGLLSSPSVRRQEARTSSPNPVLSADLRQGSDLSR